MSASILTCVGTSVLLCRHSATCSVVSASNTWIALGSPPVPRLGSSATIYILSLRMGLYQRTCPNLWVGSIPSSSSNLSGEINVSSLITKSQSISRRNRSSPSWDRCSSAQASSRSGCSRQNARNALKPLIPRPLARWLPNSSSVLRAPFQINANWSSSLLGVLVIIALPPVLSVGVMEVQNSLAIVGLTNANSSRYSSVILIPRPVFSVVVCDTMREPLSNSREPLL